MADGLDGEIALVTGGTDGIGKAIGTSAGSARAETQTMTAGSCATRQRSVRNHCQEAPNELSRCTITVSAHDAGREAELSHDRARDDE